MNNIVKIGNVYSISENNITGLIYEKENKNKKFYINLYKEIMNWCLNDCKKYQEDIINNTRVFHDIRIGHLLEKNL